MRDEKEEGTIFFFHMTHHALRITYFSMILVDICPESYYYRNGEQEANKW